MYNLLETLETRTLFAGVTLITHGWNGSITQWINTTANDVVARMGGTDAATRYTLRLDPDSQGHAAVTSYTLDSGFKHVQQTTLGEIVLVVDWTSMDTDPNHPLSEVANVITKFFQNGDADGIRLAELPLHTISQSRGTGLLDAIAKSMGQAGLWVDQQSNIDPHPIGELGDPAPVAYDNIAFEDNYWRDDGDPDNDDTDGQPVVGAFNVNTVGVQNHYDGYAHITMPAFYDGTVNLTATNDGQTNIYASDWYGDGSNPNFPVRSQTGFYFSSFVGGYRPLAGVWPASQGTAVRTPTGTDSSETQWPNVTDVRFLNDGNTVRSGKTINYRYIHQDKDSSENVTFFLDSDTNPYNNNYVRTLRRTNVKFASGIVPNRSTGGMPDVPPGTYYIAARIGDNQGHWRFSYSKSFTVTAAVHASSNSKRSTQGVTNAFGPNPPVANLNPFSNTQFGTSPSDLAKSESLETLIA